MTSHRLVVARMECRRVYRGPDRSLLIKGICRLLRIFKKKTVVNAGCTNDTCLNIGISEVLVKKDLTILSAMLKLGISYRIWELIR